MDNKVTVKGSWQQSTPVNESMECQLCLNACVKIKISSERFFFFPVCSSVLVQRKENHKEIHYEQAFQVRLPIQSFFNSGADHCSTSHRSFTAS